MAVNVIEELKKFILEDFRLEKSKNFKSKSKESFRIEEGNNQEGEGCQGVEFNTEGVDYVGFCFDRNKGKGQLDPIFPYFNTKQKAICTQNDAVLFCRESTSETYYVLLIELKSKNSGHWFKQVKAARVFVEFILQRIFITQDIDQTPTIEYRAVLFKTKRTPNEGTTRKEDSYPKSDQVPFEYGGDNLLQIVRSCHYCYDIKDFLK
jgi:hypothetical protein